MAKGKQGFAAMKEKDPERQRAVARKGGQTAQREGRGHRWTSTTGKIAGIKGGRATTQKKQSQTVFDALRGPRHCPKCATEKGVAIPAKCPHR